MTSYWIDIKKCPDCGCKFTAWEVRSCNTIGAKFFTDGFVKGPMYDEGRLLLICPRCSKCFWRDEVPTLQSMKDNEYFIKYVANSSERSFPSSGWVRGHLYEDMLEQAVWRTPDEEKYIRIRVWWSFNDAYREESTKRFRLSAKQKDNLQKLLWLLDTNNSRETIMKAEILRELGRFDGCLDHLAGPFEERYLLAVSTISKLARKKQKRPAMIG